jgi:hypothetical protein
VISSIEASYLLLLAFVHLIISGQGKRKLSEKRPVQDPIPKLSPEYNRGCQAPGDLTGSLASKADTIRSVKDTLRGSARNFWQAPIPPISLP